jgi:hypothetical protein
MTSRWLTPSCTLDEIVVQNEVIERVDWLRYL